MSKKTVNVTKKSAATIAREKKSASKIITEVPEIKAPLEKYMPKRTTEVASSSNWWLDTTTNENWAYVHDLFTADECKQIIQIGTSGETASELAYGTVGDITNATDNIAEISKVRRSPISWLRSDIKDNHWIYQRMTDAIKNINNQFFNYELTEIQSLQFTCYDAEEEGFYGKHIDMMYQGTSTRKLSVTVQLSDGGDYEGGDLLLHTAEEPTRPFRQQGTGIFFPGYTLHEVTPVTKGKRYSLVAWVLGPRFK
jgi:PKHD-type hydroxylase